MMNRQPEDRPQRKRRIFLVDDHPMVREGLANLINQQTDLAVCGQAEDGAGAIDGIEKTRPELALIDISLKNESGLELVKTLERCFPLLRWLCCRCMTKLCMRNGPCEPGRAVT